MPFYEIRVIETRQVEMDYVVEADDPEAAKAIARTGETVKEREGNLIGITNREIPPDVLPCLLLGDARP